MNLIDVLGGEIGARPAGSEAAGRAAQAVAAAFRELGLEPRLQEFSFLAYEPDEPELEVDGEPWAAGPAMYAQPAEVEGSARRIGTHVVLPGLFEPPAFAVEDGGRELARIYGNPIGGGPTPFPTGYGPTLTGPAAYVSAAEAESRLLRRMEALESLRRTLDTNAQEQLAFEVGFLKAFA